MRRLVLLGILLGLLAVPAFGQNLKRGSGVGTELDSGMNSFTIRFCGQGPNATTETFISPETGAEAGDYQPGGTNCDGQDDTTIGNADEVPLGMTSAWRLDYMYCQMSDGGTDDVVTFQFYDDTSAVAAIVCTDTLSGSGNVNCTDVATKAVTIAAASVVAIGIVADTNDNCSACDVFCIVGGVFP